MDTEVHHTKAPADSDCVPCPEDATSDSEEEDESPKGLSDGSKGGDSHEETPEDHRDADAHSSDSKHDNQRPKSRVRRPGLSLSHSGGKQPARSKEAVKPIKKGKAAAKPLKGEKAAEPVPQAPGYSTKSRTKKALAADKTKAEEKRKIFFEDKKESDKDKKDPTVE